MICWQIRREFATLQKPMNVSQQLFPSRMRHFLKVAPGIALVINLAACTDNPASLQPPPTPLPPVQVSHLEPPPREVPVPLREVYQLRCASCHGENGRSGSGGNLYQAGRRTEKRWEAFLRNPQSVEPSSKMPVVTGLTNEEYRLFGEWLSKITRHNPRSEKDKSAKSTVK